MTQSLLSYPELHREFRGLITYVPDERTTSIGNKKNKNIQILFPCFPVLRQFDAENILVMK